MNITLIPLSIVLLFLLNCIYLHFEFTYSLFAFEQPTTNYNIGNTSIAFNSNLGTNISNHWGNGINESQNDYLINISSNQGHSEFPKFEVVGKNISMIWLDDSSGYRDVYFKRSSTCIAPSIRIEIIAYIGLRIRCIQTHFVFTGLCR